MADEWDVLFATLGDIERQVRKLVRLPVPTGDQIADLLGQTRSVEVLLAEWRRTLTAEQDEPAVGTHYRTEVVRKAVRSYSTAPILAAVAERDPKGGIFGALMRLRSEGAVKLSWSWTKLQRFLAANDIELTIANHEIDDDGDTDGPMVGQVWTETTRIVTNETSRKEAPPRHNT